MRGWSALLLALCVARTGWARETWQLGTAELPPAVTAKRADQGYYPVLLRRVLQELDVDARLHFLPPVRAVLDGAAGHYTAVFPLARSAERERDFLVSEPLFTVRIRVFLRRDDDWAGRGLADLTGGLLCNIQGARLYPELETALSDGRLRMQRVSEISACFRMLAAGRVRYVVTGENTGFEGMQAGAGGAAAVRMAPLLLAEQTVHLMFPRTDPASAARRAAFDQAIRRLRAQGVMQKLEHQVLPQAPTAMR
ncbi:polar amino acid transport system substrate-binding protein [Inhella inkyongensis]|uniref:Polar amino acid transport system substrate-binding protein n=1 Tax=Inhella inkyongensis TaxID=392593 RepID=A0A840S5C3_9BURK|nr:ABC transporter substrate-binding protein [Inhella inkyongensis]MBB5204903.1 polar amino acid transport system substrate-binding protein [Inhella inkyongensis]